MVGKKKELKTKDKPFGRPPKYATPEDLNNKAEEYFEQCELTDKPITVAGLVYFLGFSDLDGFADQVNRKSADFTRTVKRIRLRIETDKSEKLLSSKGNVTGLIFDLKNNHGWIDRIDNNVNIGASDELVKALAAGRNRMGDKK